MTKESSDPVEDGSAAPSLSDAAAKDILDKSWRFNFMRVDPHGSGQEIIIA